MAACKKHQKTPVRGYSECEGCEVERLNRDLKFAQAENSRLRTVFRVNILRLAPETGHEEISRVLDGEPHH